MTRVAGRYEIVERLALGASAEVTRAIDRTTGAQVWLKRLSPVHDDIEHAAERLAREARIGARLSAPETVPVLDFSVRDRERPWLVTAWLDGVTLQALLATTHVPAPAGVRIVADAARGLHHVHTRGRVVHGDVCPDNILVGVDGRARIVDLGSAFEPGTPARALGAQGRRRYRAPELREPDATLDARADVYALGQVLRGLALADASLMQVVAAACAPAPADRLRDALTVAEALEAWLAQQAGDARGQIVTLLRETTAPPPGDPG